MGVVNVYRWSDPVGAEPSHTFLNLTTPIRGMCFGGPHDEMLSFYSNRLKRALRIAHLPSGTVFSNFPPLGKVRRVQCAGFSSNAGYFAAGNDMGRVLLYRLRHFEDF